MAFDFLVVEKLAGQVDYQASSSVTMRGSGPDCLSNNENGESKEESNDDV